MRVITRDLDLIKDLHFALFLLTHFLLADSSVVFKCSDTAWRRGVWPVQANKELDELEKTIKRD